MTTSPGSWTVLSGPTTRARLERLDGLDADLPGLDDAGAIDVAAVLARTAELIAHSVPHHRLVISMAADVSAGIRFGGQGARRGNETCPCRDVQLTGSSGHLDLALTPIRHRRLDRQQVALAQRRTSSPPAGRI